MGIIEELYFISNNFAGFHLYCLEQLIVYADANDLINAIHRSRVYSGHVPVKEIVLNYSQIGIRVGLTICAYHVLHDGVPPLCP